VADEPERERPARRESVCVLGNGGWGTALALVARGNGHDVALWGVDPEYVAETASTRSNPRYLPGVELPRDLVLTSDVAAASAGATLLVSAVPTQYLRATAARWAPALPASVPVVSVTKGIEIGTLARPTEILAATLSLRSLAVLSGPSHAEEVARGGPTSVVVASQDAELAELVQRVFGTERLRIYATDDVLGVEIAAAVKNVIAVAAGVCDGLGLGDNAKAALITRGNAEITRLGRAMGARTETFAGLAGIGDLITTCVSRHGRNRGFGERLGRGERTADIQASMVQVAEGVRSAEAVVELARRFGVEMPISEQVRRMLFGGQRPEVALRELMSRATRAERDPNPAAGESDAAGEG
jgi:glycerol-3-phosphate dehydrogenase (NAD(P)+)